MFKYEQGALEVRDSQSRSCDFAVLQKRVHFIGQGIHRDSKADAGR